MGVPSEPAGAPGSRLGRASSLYLRSAAGQPIDWYPWGSEPFEVARRAGRPVLLDIGASWCHWCHVMDEGTYADHEVARLLGEHFVAVKVDRDEHPEVDRRYQRQVHALTGEGGWPLTAFLTPDGDAFFGGTYFPPSDDHGRPGFRRLLSEIARLWKDEPGSAHDRATTIRDATARSARQPPAAVSDLAGFVDGTVRELRGSFDPGHGGFGGAPKFPHATAIALLLWDEHRTPRPPAESEARETLVAMANGGLYDQLGGGFHRYSVDPAWRVPHFEKMGVDNAELLSVYVDGFRRFREPRFEEVVRGLVRWSRAVLGDAAGGWGASQDADNAPGDDGGYFTWSRAELRELLEPEEARFVSRVFGVGTEARMPHDPERNVLFRLLAPPDAADGLDLKDDPERVLRRASETMLAARGRRPEPQVDRALYASINGRFVSAFSSAASVFHEPAWLADARRAADRWLASGVDPVRGVAHRLDASGAHGHGLLDDQVSLARGLLDLAVADASPVYLGRATELLVLVDREFRGEQGLLHDVAPRLYDGPAVGAVAAPSFTLEDSPHLSPNAAAALAFLRLGVLLHDDRWRERGRELAAALAARLDGAGVFGAGAALAAGLWATPPVQVVVEGRSPSAEALLAVSRRTWHPNLAVFSGHPPAPFSLPSEAAVPAAEPSGARAIVCFERSCAPPVNEPAELERLLVSGRAA